MEFKKFQIKNFRGIVESHISLSPFGHLPIYPLVGLNESGKTTILEAINYAGFSTGIEEIAQNVPGYKIIDNHTTIPVAQRMNFNDSVKISTTLSFSSKDLLVLKEFLREKHDFVMTNSFQELNITRVSAFENSQFAHKKSKNYWALPIQGKIGKQRKPKDYSSESAIWHDAARFIQETLIPEIYFFPNFLFDFPERIYLTGESISTQKGKFYFQLLSDILAHIDKKLDVQTHIISRIKSNDVNDRRNFESLLFEVGRKISVEVFSAWNAMVNQSQKEKRIVLSQGTDENGDLFIELKIEDGDGFYSIHERSLGFRWFFTFLLLTKFRTSKKITEGKTLFLLDEPASNLHQAAQTQLLKTLEALAKSCQIVYTTHSHYLINPLWLNNTFIVKNEGLDYKDDSSFSSHRTNIKVYSYRCFASQQADQTHYFKPILDVLSYCPSDIELRRGSILLEGKSDYFLFRYFAEVILKKKFEFHLVPCVGSGGMAPVAEILASWGWPFLIFLDSDPEGLKQAQRYKKKYEGVSGFFVYTFQDIDESWKGFEAETMLTNEECLSLINSVFPGETSRKKMFLASIQEVLKKKIEFTFSAETNDKFERIFDFWQDIIDIQEMTI